MGSAEPPTAMVSTREAVCRAARAARTRVPLQATAGRQISHFILPGRRVQVGALDVWTTAIRKVEGRQGSVVATALQFIRFGLAVNCLQTLVWGLLVTLPFVCSPPKPFAWTLFKATKLRYLLQGYGLGTTFFLYGGYVVDSKTQRSRPDLAFPIAYTLAYALTIVFLSSALYQRLQGFSHGSPHGAITDRLYPFSTLTFASWNFRTVSSEAAQLERRALRSQLKELVSDLSLQETFVSPNARAKARLRKALSLSLLWPTLMGLTGLATYMAVVHSSKINAACGLSYMSSLIVTGVNIAGSALVTATVDLEGWAPRSQVKVAAVKLFTLKADYMGVFLYSLFCMRESANKTSIAPESVQSLTKCDPAQGALADSSCSGGFSCCGAVCLAELNRTDLLGRCIPGCVENVYGQLFYKQIMTNGIVINIVDVAVAAVQRWLLKMHAPFESHVVIMQTVENGVLVLLGSLFFPLLPALGAIGNVFTFYVKLATALWVYNPPKTRTSVARMSILAYLLMAGGVVLSSFPLVLNLEWQRHRCGPNQGSSMRAAIVHAVNKGPSVVSSILGFLVSPIALLTVVLGLACALVLLRCLVKRAATEASSLQQENRLLRKANRLAMRRDFASRGGDFSPSGAKARHLTVNAGHWAVRDNAARNTQDREGPSEDIRN